MNDRKSRLAEIRELANKLEGTPPGLDPKLFEELLAGLRAPRNPAQKTHVSVKRQDVRNEDY